MLGRLQMDMDECISAYCKIMDAIFNKETKFSLDPLQPTINDFITNRDEQGMNLFNDGKDRGCKV
jgi:hypothetical protein